MRVFLTGATGYIGQVLTRELVAAGHEVTGLVRLPERAAVLEAAGGRPVVGDIKVPESYRAAAAESQVAIHTAQEYTPEGAAADRSVVDTLLALAAMRSGEGPRHLVYTSGIWVLGHTDDGPVFEDASAEHPAALVAWRAAHEKVVLTADSEEVAVAVVRPGIVYGGEGGGIPTDYFKSAERDGAARFVGNGRNRVPFIHVEDLARFYRAVVERRGRGIFHAVDGAAIQLEDAARAASEAAGKGGAVRSVPLESARAKMGVRADALALDQFVQSGRNAELGWQPEVPSFLAGAERAYREWKQRASA